MVLKIFRDQLGEPIVFRECPKRWASNRIIDKRMRLTAGFSLRRLWDQTAPETFLLYEVRPLAQKAIAGTQRARCRCDKFNGCLVQNADVIALESLPKHRFSVVGSLQKRGTKQWTRMLASNKAPPPSPKALMISAKWIKRGRRSQALGKAAI